MLLVGAPSSPKIPAAFKWFKLEVRTQPGKKNSTECFLERSIVFKLTLHQLISRSSEKSELVPFTLFLKPSQYPSLNQQGSGIKDVTKYINT